VSLHLLDLLVNNVQILEWVSPKSLSDRAMSSRVDAILYMRRSTDVVLPFGEDGAVLVKELPNLSLLLFSQLFRETAHHLRDYVDFGS